MPLPVDDVPVYLDQLSRGIVAAWASAPRDQAPRQVGAAVRRLANTEPRSRDAVDAAAEVAELVLPACEAADTWCDDGLRTLTRGLVSALRQYHYSAEAKNLLRLCEQISRAACARPRDTAVDTRLVAALMLVEDATCAVEAYRVQPSFRQVDDAYLAKFGLLQALQLGFDAAERLCRTCGVKARADRSTEGKAVTITRTIVAGHPLGGNMASRRWLHFHDRSTAHESDVIRVMSFLEEDPEIWTGQSQSTMELVSNGLEVMRELLSQARAYLPDPIPEGATGLLFPSHAFSKRYTDPSL